MFLSEPIHLLNKKVVFKDLGMLVVDEEQRFGVAQKEKWKEWASNIDVLTLSATPIPRTLHMSLCRCSGDVRYQHATRGTIAGSDLCGGI